MRGSRGGIERVELLRPSRERRWSGRPKPRRPIAVIELGILTISGAPVTKNSGSAPHTSLAEGGGKNDFSERVECGGIALQVRRGSSVRTSNDRGQRDCRGERREERSPRQREGRGRHGMTMESPRGKRQSAARVHAAIGSRVRFVSSECR